MISATAAAIIGLLAATGSFRSQNSATGPKAANTSNGAVDPAAEAARRKSILNGLIMDYIQSHPDAPVGYHDILIAAEPYINERLDKLHEPFRFDARSSRFVDGNEPSDRAPAPLAGTIQVQTPARLKECQKIQQTLRSLFFLWPERNGGSRVASTQGGTGKIS